MGLPETYERRRRRTSPAPAAALLLLLAARVEGAPPAASLAAVSCPPELAAESRVLAPPPGWEVGYQDGSYPLAALTFYDGPPSEKKVLAASKRHQRTKTSTALFRFPANDGRGYWIACAYANTHATIFRRVPAELAECVVTYDRKATVAGKPEIVQVDCK